MKSVKRIWIEFAVFCVAVLLLVFAKEHHTWWGYTATFIYSLCAGIGVVYLIHYAGKILEARADAKFVREHDGKMLKVDGIRFENHEDAADYISSKYDRGEE